MKLNVIVICIIIGIIAGLTADYYNNKRIEKININNEYELKKAEIELEKVRLEGEKKIEEAY